MIRLFIQPILQIKSLNSKALASLLHLYRSHNGRNEEPYIFFRSSLPPSLRLVSALIDEFNLSIKKA